MTTALDAALDYATRGWHVFPVTPAPNKRPLCEGGFHAATRDHTQIARWWGANPGAQIGVACGASQLVAVDLDEKPKEMISGRASLDTLGIDAECGSALVMRTPRNGGLQLFFYMPPNDRVHRQLGVLPGIDILGDGGYTIVPSPASPGREWLVGDPFDDDDLQGLPPWARDLTRRKAEGAPVPATAGGSRLSDQQIRDIGDALSYIDCEDRGTWIKVGMALKSTGDEFGWDLWESWSSTSEKFDEQDQRYQWERLHELRKDGSEITLATLFYMAKQNGYRPAPTPFDDPPPPDRAPTTPLRVVARWGEEGPLIHKATGWPTLDQMTRGGLVFGMVTVLVGAPDGAKTLAQVCMADRWAQEDVMVGVLAIDEDADGLVTRLVQRRSMTRESCETRTEDDLEDMSRHLLAVEDRLLFYDESYTIEEAAADLAERAAAEGLRAALMVDSLQTCRAQGEDQSTGLREQVTRRMLSLKLAAKRHQMIVVATSEMARAGYRTKEGAAELNHLALGKESGSIEYQAKVVVSLQRDPEEKTRVQLKVVKNKLGATHDFDIDDFLALDLDLSVQTLLQDEDHRSETRQEREERRQSDREERARLVSAKNAATLVVAIVARQGISKNQLENQLQAAGKGLGAKPYGAALAALGDGLRIIKGARGAHLLHVHGEDVPQGILDLIPDPRERDRVMRCTAPDEALTPYECEAK